LAIESSSDTKANTEIPRPAAQIEASVGARPAIDWMEAKPSIPA
jgi:hypothetical protein